MEKEKKKFLERDRNAVFRVIIINIYGFFSSSASSVAAAAEFSRYIRSIRISVV